MTHPSSAPAGSRGILRSLLASPLAILTILLLVAAVLRLYGLNSLSPPGIEHDEVANWLIDRSLLAGNHTVYFTRAYGHEAGFHYLQAAFVALLGDHPLALRLPAAFLGLLLAPITYALGRQLLGSKSSAIFAAALIAVLFWPVFYSRLGLRAMALAVLAGLAACVWQRAWQAKRQRRELMLFALAGALAGLSLHTYMAARALPIFFLLYTLYLALWHRDALQRRWRGMLLFWLLYALVAAPLLLFLLTTPGAEARVGEVDAPLRALLAGDPRPALENGIRILGMFGWGGDPLWRQNVAGRPVLDPLLGLAFYAGLGWSLWHWRERRQGFMLLWMAALATPSLVTVDAPSSIRLIGLLPVFPLILTQLINETGQLSTVIPKLSTSWAYFFGSIFVLYHIWGTAVAVFHRWPAHDEVQFVWQTALRDTAAYLDDHPEIEQAAIGGWSPDTLDPPTMELLLRRDDLVLSHFSPPNGTLLLPNGEPIHLFRPAILALDPFWEGQLAAWEATVTAQDGFVHYRLGERPSLSLTEGEEIIFGDEWRWLGYAKTEEGLLTAWEVVASPGYGRRLFLHWLDDAGEIVAQDHRWDTADPQNLWHPHRQPGDLILQYHPLPPEAAAVAVRVGIYNPYTCDPGPCRNLTTEEGETFVTVNIKQATENNQRDLGESPDT